MKKRPVHEALGLTLEAYEMRQYLIRYTRGLSHVGVLAGRLNNACDLKCDDMTIINELYQGGFVRLSTDQNGVYVFTS